MPAEMGTKISATKTALINAINAISPAAPSPSAAQKDGFATLLAIGSANNVLKQSAPEKSAKREEIQKSSKEDDQKDMVAALVADPQAQQDNRKTDKSDFAARNTDKAIDEAAQDSKAPAEKSAKQEKAATGDDVPAAAEPTDDTQSAVATTPASSPEETVADAAPQEAAQDIPSFGQLLQLFHQPAFNLIHLLVGQGHANGFIQKALSAGDITQINPQAQNGNATAIDITDPRLKPFFDALAQLRQDFKAFSSLLVEGGPKADTVLTGPQIIQARELLLSLKSDIQAMQEAVAQIAPSPKNEAAFQAVLEKLQALHTALGKNLPMDAAPAASTPSPILTQGDAALPLVSSAQAVASAPVIAKAETPVQANNAPANPQAETLVAAPVAATASTSANADTSGQQQGGQSSNGSLAQASAPAFASAASPGSSAQIPAFARVLTQQTYQPLADQVMVNIKTAIKDGSSKIKIQLHPEELGKLEIKLHVGADGKTGVTITADSRDTLALLQKDSAGLERALADAGLKTESGGLSFNLRGGHKENNPEHSQATSNYLKTLPDEEEVLPVNVISRNYVVNLADGLDIKI